MRGMHFTIAVLACVMLARPPRAAAQDPPETDRLPFEIAESREAEREEEERIETDRDSFTPALRTAGRNRLIVEAAYSFLDNRGVPETHSFPELLLRYGVSKRIELRFGVNYEVGGEGNETSGSAAGEDFEEGPRIVRASRVFYGIKALVTEQNGWVPDSVIIFQGFTPTSGPSGDTQLLAIGAVGWELPNRWRLDASLHYATSSEGEDHFGVLAPSAVIRVPVGERVNVHAEYFGLYSRDRAVNFTRHFFSPGVHYLVTPDLEVGVRLGWGLNDQSARFFSNFGFGWRF